MPAIVNEEPVSGMDLRNLDAATLVSLCAADTANTALWSEFLRRFEPRIRAFIRRPILNLPIGLPLSTKGRPLSHNDQEKDLCQNTIFRLVDHNCALLKRFIGTSDEDFEVYLAVVTRSVIRDCLRRRRASKRPCEELRVESQASTSARAERAYKARENQFSTEQQVLAKELWDLSIRTLKKSSGQSYARDLRIFELYFSQGLTVKEISSIREIGLSKTAVGNVLNRVKDRVRDIACAGSGRVVSSIQKDPGQA